MTSGGGAFVEAVAAVPALAWGEMDEAGFPGWLEIKSAFRAAQE